MLGYIGDALSIRGPTGVMTHSLRGIQYSGVYMLCTEQW